MFRKTLAVALFVPLFVGGCGPKQAEIVPASGTLTIDGKPLGNVTIFTEPLVESDKRLPRSISLTDDEGRFELELESEEVMGAVPGKTRVTIMERGEGDPGFRRRFPLDYQNGIVEVEIPAEGTDQLDIDITKKKRR